MIDKYRILFVALVIGIASYFLGEVVFLFSLFGLISYFIYKNTNDEDKNFILTVLVIGFLLRAAFAVLFHGANFLKGYHGISGDDLLYTVKSWGLVYRWEGRPYNWVADLAGSSPKFGMNPFTYILALFYKVFGFHPVSSKLINCIIGALIGWVTYLMATEMFNRRTARISMLIVTFYPSIMRWSIANLKDPLIMLLFMVCVYVLIDAAGRKIRIWKFVVFALSGLLLYEFTPKLYFILIAVCAMLVVGLRFFKMLSSRKARITIIAVVTFALSAGAYYFSYIKTAPLIELIYKFEEKQNLMARADYAGYYFYSGKFMENLSCGIVSLSSLLDIAYKNVVYFMLAPFPWQLTSPERLLAFPQMILWYLMLLLSFFGFMKLIIRKSGMAFLIGILLIVGITVSALAEGNIGSAFRHRDMFTPFVAIFASAIISDLISRKNSLIG